jgi:hypothetical protein
MKKGVTMEPSEPMEEMGLEKEPTNPSQQLAAKLAKLIDSANQRADREISEGWGMLEARVQHAQTILRQNPRLVQKLDLAEANFSNPQTGDQGLFLIDKSSGGIVSLQTTADGYLSLQPEPPLAMDDPTKPDMKKKFNLWIDETHPQASKTWSEMRRQ